jgi:hypothetical protein
VIEARVATRVEKNPVVEVLLVEVRFVVASVVPVAEVNESAVVVADDAKKLVAVALVSVRLVKNPDTAVRKEEKRLVLVENVVEAKVATRLVAVAEVIFVLPSTV